MGGLLRIVIVVAFLVILVSLGSALYHLYRGESDSTQMLRALTVRIALSLALFALIMIAWWAGLITPVGLQAHSPRAPACTGASCPPGPGGG